MKLMEELDRKDDNDGGGVKVEIGGKGGKEIADFKKTTGGEKGTTGKKTTNVKKTTTDKKTKTDKKKGDAMIKLQDALSILDDSESDEEIL